MNLFKICIGLPSDVTGDSDTSPALRMSIGEELVVTEDGCGVGSHDGLVDGSSDFSIDGA